MAAARRGARRDGREGAEQPIRVAPQCEWFVLVLLHTHQSLQLAKLPDAVEMRLGRIRRRPVAIVRERDRERGSKNRGRCSHRVGDGSEVARSGRVL